MPNFQTFSTAHLIVLGLTLGVPILLAAIAQRRAATVIGYLLAGVLLTNEVTNWCYRFAEFSLSDFIRNHLPLHACGIAVLATAAALLFRNQRAYEIAYFWGLVGSSNAVITPSLGVEEGISIIPFLPVFRCTFWNRRRCPIRDLGLADAPETWRSLPCLCLPKPLCPGRRGIQRRYGIELHVSLRTSPDGLSLLLRALALVYSHTRPSRVRNVLRRLLPVSCIHVVVIPQISRPSVKNQSNRHR